MSQKNNLVIGFDIGTRSIVGVAAVNDFDEKDHFRVVAAHVEYHSSRSMVDGQIQDINAVAKTIYKVKKALEAKIQDTITEVYVAAAGRVLQTVVAEVEKEEDASLPATPELISSLELMALDKAKQELQGEGENRYYAIGHSVMKYFLNGYEIANLLDQRGSKMGLRLLATFLPVEVVESLYQVVEKAGMKVAYMTLEPIAASQIAIPVSLRLLNIALVDIGAGTSDIAITNGGTIMAYGMIPIAGDEITETIVQTYLVDFETAEQMKIDASKGENKIQYRDIMDLDQTVKTNEFLSNLKPALESLSTKIAEKILELNGDKAPNAVFIVGGGGQVKGFSDLLAHKIGLPENRVALRGKESLKEIEISDPTFQRSPEFITPIGICYKGLADSRRDFVQVLLNEKPVRLFNKKNLTVMDIMAAEGIDPRNFLLTKGNTLRFYFNGKAHQLEGEYGTVAEIYKNNEKAVLSDPVEMNDYIVYQEAKRGKHARISIRQFMMDYLGYRDIDIDKEMYYITVNGKLIASAHQMIQNEDRVFCRIRKEEDAWYVESESEDTPVSEREMASLPEVTVEDKPKPSVPQEDSLLHVVANGEAITLKGKKQYIFVDIFDHIAFDRSQVKGRLVITRNGEPTTYFEALLEGDVLEVYWQ